MNRFYPILLLLFLIGNGCSWKYQVFNIESENVQHQQNNWFVSTNVDLELNYDFWSNGGVPLLTIYNRTDKAITLWLKDSHFGVNKDSLDYTDANHLYENTHVPDTMQLLPQREVTLEIYPVTFQWQRLGTKELTRYERSTSPLKINNTLVYTLANNPQRFIMHDQFWVSGIHKMTKSDFKTYTNQSNRKAANFFVKKPPSGFWLEVAIATLDALVFTLAAD